MSREDRRAVSSLVDAHEEFGAVLSEVDVKCVEILDVAAPPRPATAASPARGTCRRRPS